MKRSFTLIEILGVIALIAVLAAIGFAGYSFATNRSKESATKSMVARLEAALKSGQEREGFLPEAASFTVIVIDADNGKIKFGSSEFSKNSTKKNEANFYKDFIKSIQADSLGRHLNADKQVTDGWGNVIYYRYPGIFNKGSFDLISAGSDGKFGKSDASSPSSSISDYRDDKGEMICDDLGNF